MPAPVDRFRDNPMGFADDGFILREAMEQSFGTGLWVHPMAGGHRPGVRIELSGAENLGAERHLSGAPRVRSPPRLPAREDRRGSFERREYPHAAPAPTSSRAPCRHTFTIASHATPFKQDRAGDSAHKTAAADGSCLTRSDGMIQSVMGLGDFEGTKVGLLRGANFQSSKGRDIVSALSRKGGERG